MATSSVVRTSPDICVITCPRCEQGIPVPTAQLRLSQEPLHVPCACGCMLRLVRMDQRRFPRKPVDLIGALLDVTTHTLLTPVTIIDLSLGGVRFAAQLSSLQVGESYRIGFRLDDAIQTEIQADIAIRILHTDQTFGAEFLHPECDDELDFYLNPWGVRF
ncbi:MAG: PilZ domain-containing protein [Candidatus Tectomicrobia bacterium]|nr:PilZ domain-containing protein [Candidatus Tectomicrobia bacterium]